VRKAGHAPHRLRRVPRRHSPGLRSSTVNSSNASKCR
jgi:hypothetical protein